MVNQTDESDYASRTSHEDVEMSAEESKSYEVNIS